MKVKLLSHVRLLATPWTAAYQAPPSMGFSRQEYWSGVPLPFPPNPVLLGFSDPPLAPAVPCMVDPASLYLSLPTLRNIRTLERFRARVMEEASVGRGKTSVGLC